MHATGPGIVTTLRFTPLLIIVLALLPVLIWRLKDEERFLARNLPGYGGYQRSVRYRLLPGIW